MKKETKRKLTEWLISFAVTLTLLAVVVGIQFWLTNTASKTLDAGAIWRGNLIGDAVGGVLLLLIVHHYVKAPTDKKNKRADKY